MDKGQVAEVLVSIATLLELKGENPFKARAYLNAARTSESLGDPVLKGCKTEFFDSCDFMGIKRFLYIGPYIPLPDLLRTAARGAGHAALRPKA
jgi:DNA polymerase/3'-5' exonuclease PolX